MAYDSNAWFWDATTPLAAAETFAERRRMVILTEAVRVGKLVGRFPLDTGLDDAAVALAVLAAYDHGWGAYLPRDHGDPLEVVRQFLHTRIPGRVGTNGDYDMPLVLFTAIVVLYPHLLGDDLITYMLEIVLSQKGSIPRRDLVDSPIPFFEVAETENHVANIEIARHLTNELEGRKNWDLQVTQFLLNGLRSFLRFDFTEFNARPYQNHVVRAITVLYDCTTEPNLRAAARLVLDYLTAKFAVSSSGLRRHVPFRRRAESTWIDQFFRADADQEAPRFLALTGMGSMFRLGDQSFSSLTSEISVPAVLSGYRPPAALQHLIMRSEGRQFYQLIRHYGVEVFSSTPDFLISAGGFWLESVHGYDEMPGVRFKDNSVPFDTVIMPTEGGTEVTQLVGIEGPLDKSWNHAGTRARNNTGVAPGFACGLNPRVPALFWQARDVRRHDHLALIDCTTMVPRLQLYVAVWIGPNEDPGWTLVDRGTFGWVLVESPSRLSFDDFEHAVLAGGGRGPFTVSGINRLTPDPLPSVTFTPGGDRQNKYRWPIRHPNGDWIDVAQWPLAIGDVINSEGHSGVVHIDHPLFSMLGRDGLAAKGIRHPYRLRQELRRHGGGTARGLVGELRTRLTAWTPPPAGIRTLLDMRRRRLTLDLYHPFQPGRYGPRYTAREALLLYGADPSQGLRQLFAYERGQREIRLSELVTHRHGRYTVREACRLQHVDPRNGLRSAFRFQNSLRGRPFALSTRLQD